MNIINKLTLRHLKENKRRSLVTIIGVIISVAMISAVATLSVSFLDLMIRQDLARNGEWHVQYKNVNTSQLEAIEEDSETEKLALSNDGYAALEGSSNKNKPYVYFKNYDKTGMTQFPIQVKEGRLPLSDNEVAISEEIAKNANVNYKIGDQLNFDIGDRWNEAQGISLSQNDSLNKDESGAITEELQIEESKTVTIVGTIERPTWEPTWSPGYTVIGYIEKDTLNETDTVDAFVVLDKVRSSLYDHSEKIASEQGIEKVNYNSDLLRYYGVTDNDNLRMTLLSLSAIIMAVIIIGSIALIYNAFAISVSERAKHLGMLSSVGATRKQKRNSVFFEGAVIGAISIPIGIIAGLAGIATTFVFINGFLAGALGTTEKLELVVTPASILIACAISIVTIFISTFVPAQKASKISAIDAIRQTHDIKLSGKAIKTSKFVRKVFGLEAEIGLKNVKRNRKRYLATVFSLVISIVLFLSVSFFTANLKKSLEMSQNDISYDIQISSDELDTEQIERYTQMEHVTQSTVIKEAQLEALIDKEEVSNELKKIINEDDSVLEDGKYPYYISLQGLDEESFKDYAKLVGVDAADFNKQDTPTAIVIETISYQDYEAKKFVETKAIESEVGNEIRLYNRIFSDTNETSEREFVSNVKIGALTDHVPMGIYTNGLGGLNIIVSEETMKNLVADRANTNTYVYLNTNDPMATQEAIEEGSDSNVHVYNVFERRQQNEQLILLMSVFIYGFITLISLISIANIFNTISTSISLRKREFAMLRSVGMTPKGFNKMINYESIFYGVKALAYGLPISLLVMLAIHRSLRNTFEYGFTLPWVSILFVIAVIFIIVGSAMLYSIAKIKNENIIDGLKQENT
ncbi:putative ABC transport system permease protein [Mesobacillus persicus]|uniref:Putative ABC transport system permease protein n=1 Tax=Mesobacillus persicus TaxID=930146 RepID=A0A1H8JXF4_9BACI|nr:ABC transporter permease [Mesobacillus persicus]SEN85399.1 putative ABC transport system permease protein [Mesobacillus persicus]